MVSTPKPNGFADHYPYEKWLFHWEYPQHFQTNPYDNNMNKLNASSRQEVYNVSVIVAQSVWLHSQQFTTTFPPVTAMIRRKFLHEALILVR